MRITCAICADELWGIEECRGVCTGCQHIEDRDAEPTRLQLEDPRLDEEGDEPW